MGVRFRKSVKIAPGIRATVGKKSASVSIGTTGARHTISTTGKKTTTVGVPGSGLSHVSTSSAKQGKGSGASVQHSPRTYKVCGVLMIALAVLCLLLGLPTIAAGGWLFLLIGVPCLIAGVSFIKKSKE